MILSLLLTWSLYPSNDDRDKMFKAYIMALKEDPVQYRSDAQKLEEWACLLNAIP